MAQRKKDPKIPKSLEFAAALIIAIRDNNTEEALKALDAYSGSVNISLSLRSEFDPKTAAHRAGKTLLSLALKHRNFTLVQQLVKRGAEFNFLGLTLTEAILAGDRQTTEVLLQHGGELILSPKNAIGGSSYQLFHRLAKARKYADLLCYSTEAAKIHGYHLTARAMLSTINCHLDGDFRSMPVSNFPDSIVAFYRQLYEYGTHCPRPTQLRIFRDALSSRPDVFDLAKPYFETYQHLESKTQLLKYLRNELVGLFNSETLFLFNAQLKTLLTCAEKLDDSWRSAAAKMTVPKKLSTYIYVREVPMSLRFMRAPTQHSGRLAMTPDEARVSIEGSLTDSLTVTETRQQSILSKSRVFVLSRAVFDLFRSQQSTAEVVSALRGLMMNLKDTEWLSGYRAELFDLPPEVFFLPSATRQTTTTRRRL